MVFLIALLAGAGCTTTHISSVGNSWTVIRKSTFTKHSIADIEAIPTTNGLTFRMTGYRSDQVQALGVAVDAAVTAAIKGAK